PAAPVGAAERDLVGANAEAPDGEQAPRLGQRRRRHPRLRADAQHVDVADPLDQLLLLERARRGLDVEALAAQDLVRRRVDVLEQEDLDLVLGEGRDGLAHRADRSTFPAPAQASRRRAPPDRPAATWTVFIRGSPAPPG